MELFYDKGERGHIVIYAWCGISSWEVESVLIGESGIWISFFSVALREFSVSSRNFVFCSSRSMLCWMLRFAFFTRSLGAGRGWGVSVGGECSGLDGGIFPTAVGCVQLERAMASVVVMIWALYLLCWFEIYGVNVFFHFLKWRRLKVAQFYGNRWLCQFLSIWLFSVTWSCSFFAFQYKGKVSKKSDLRSEVWLWEISGFYFYYIV